MSDVVRLSTNISYSMLRDQRDVVVDDRLAAREVTTSHSFSVVTIIPIVNISQMQGNK